MPAAPPRDFPNLVVLTCSDTTISNNPYFKLQYRRETATWDPDQISGPAIIRVFKKYGESEQVPVKVFFDDPDGDYGLTHGDTVTYTSHHYTVDTILYDTSGFWVDKLDKYDQSGLAYSAVAISRLAPGSGTPGFSGGFAGDTFYVSPAIVSAPIRFVINHGDLYTENNVVTLSGTFKATNVDSVTIYRYSAIRPLTDIDSLTRIDISNGYKTYSSPPQCVWFEDSLNLGIFRKPDVLAIGAMTPDKGFTVAYLDADSGYIRFTKKDTLAPYAGRKWVVFKAGGTRLYDDIDIKPYKCLLEVDLERASIIEERDLHDTICVLDDVIPFHFYAYGDRSFNPEIRVWMATRKLYSKFFTGGPVSAPTPGEFGPDLVVDAGLYTWPDCIFETVPETFQLDPFGRFRGRLLEGFDYKSGYRASPLAYMAKTGSDLTYGSFKTDLLLEGMYRSEEKNGTDLNLMVKPGSILGYDTASLDQFTIDTIYTENLTDTMLVPSWHTITDFNDIQAAGGLDAYINANYSAEAAQRRYRYGIVSDFCLDLDGNLYQHPMRGLPTTARSAISGTKEFILIAYATGKYFNEPRVITSTFNSRYTYVWDKIPPQIVWAISNEANIAQWDPNTNSFYAPMCYKDPENPANDRCTDLSALGLIFDVYLSRRDFTNTWTSVREAGFGAIRAVRLLFNYQDNYLGMNPLTGERQYTTPNIYFDLPAEVIASQIKDKYSGKSEDTPTSIGYTLVDISFKNIDARGWQNGLWDMWMETEDDLGNRGLAPYGTGLKPKDGSTPVRQIEIK